MFQLVLGGGLGNQMFQYAYARNLQEKYKIEVSYNCWHYNYESNREFALNNLSVSDSILKSEDIDLQRKMYERVKKIQKALNCFVPTNIRYSDSFFHFLNCLGVYYTPNTYHYIATKPITRDNGTIIGAFQSWKYFEENKEIICQELRVSTRPSLENEKLLHEISSCNAVCVHIRRGDYVGTDWSKTLDICGYDYYQKGMKYISEHVVDPVFYIFSNSIDDIKWIKEHYSFEYPLRFVELNNPDYEELRLMYSCKHFIISNSTFSWWGQYLAQYNKKIVIAPSLWNRRKDIDCSDIYMNSWICIDV